MRVASRCPAEILGEDDDRRQGGGLDPVMVRISTGLSVNSKQESRRLVSRRVGARAEEELEQEQKKLRVKR